jgi:hypothetical protein
LGRSDLSWFGRGLAEMWAMRVTIRRTGYALALDHRFPGLLDLQASSFLAWLQNNF